ncbi:N-6 DNA methylase [Malaciobacter marinus]|uniref:N-6 DNA methylase n=1 Tax=Malaciobacter marinus TaxID=505249 RepID=UPI0013FD33D7|nr:N-6 DNA methylase [Malaciobacter marinus]
MSLLYFAKYHLKDLNIQYFANRGGNVYELDNHWFEILNQKSKHYLHSSERINEILENKFKLWTKLYGKDFTQRIKKNFENIGLFKVLKDKNIDDFISLIDNSEFNLDDIFDIYTQVITPNRYNNDFFTPMDLCDSVAKFVGTIKKDSVSIYDPTCGIGNLLYAKFKELRTNYPKLDIEIFGNDRDSCYSSFADAMFHLFHNKAYFENKDILIEDAFPGKKMNIIIANPPFGVISKSDYEKNKARAS